MEIDEQVSRMLDLVVEHKLRVNKLNQTRCLDNEEDEDGRKCEEELREQAYKLDVECYCIE